MAEEDADFKITYEMLKGAKAEAKGKMAALTAVAPADPLCKSIAEKAKKLQ